MELPPRENAKIWCVPHLDGLNLLRATIVRYSFKRHMHDYFVIGMVEAGLQKFAYGRDQYITPPTGIIIINPGEAHTGEAAVATGFHYRALYPQAEFMQQIASEVKGTAQGIPFFTQPVIHDVDLYEEIRSLHQHLESTASVLEQESRYWWALARLIIRHADTRHNVRPVGQERAEVRRIRRYIDERYAENLRLAELAALVNWTPFYLLRVFRKAVGLPPHAYLNTVRIRESQRLLLSGTLPAQVAYDTGFSSQSHFTTVFKQLIGVTPGQYAQQVNFLKDRDDSPGLL